MGRRPAILAGSPSKFNEIILEWDDENVDLFKKHNITPEEVASIFESRIYCRQSKGFYNFYGRSRGGRILLVITEKSDNNYRVITSREATNSEKALYVKRGK